MRSVTKPNLPKSVAIAIGAHPDDIEFYMAGTLLLLQRAGWEIHYLNVANGCCGSVQYNACQLARIRLDEAKRAAKVLGAHFHPPICNDMEIVYDLKLVRRIAAVIREVKPTVILTHPPVDYMEDHTNTCRIVVTAAFAHAMPNFRSLPPRPEREGERIRPRPRAGSASPDGARPFRERDPISRVHWKRTAQRGTPWVRTFEDEESSGLRLRLEGAPIPFDR